MTLRKLSFAWLCSLIAAGGSTQASPQTVAPSSPTNGEVKEADGVSSVAGALPDANVLSPTVASAGSAGSAGSTAASSVAGVPAAESIRRTTQSDGSYGVAPQPLGEYQLKLFTLKYAQAADVCDIVRGLFKGDVRLKQCQADPRTNTLLVLGEASLHDAVGAAIAELDTETAPGDIVGRDVGRIRINVNDAYVAIQDHDRRIAELRDTLATHERNAVIAAKELRLLDKSIGTDHPERKAGEDRLKAEVAGAFAARQALQKAQASRIESRLEELTQRIAYREEHGDAMIEQRVRHLSAETTELATDIELELEIVTENNTFESIEDVRSSDDLKSKESTKKSRLGKRIENKPGENRAGKKSPNADNHTEVTTPGKSADRQWVGGDTDNALLNVINAQAQTQLAMERAQVVLKEVQIRKRRLAALIAAAQDDPSKEGSERSEKKAEIDRAIVEIEAEQARAEAEVAAAQAFSDQLQVQADMVKKIAELESQRAMAELDNARQVAEKQELLSKTGVIAAEELAQAKLELQRAELEVEKRRVILDALEKGSRDAKKADGKKDAGATKPSPDSELVPK